MRCAVTDPRYQQCTILAVIFIEKYTFGQMNDLFLHLMMQEASCLVKYHYHQPFFIAGSSLKG